MSDFRFKNGSDVKIYADGEVLGGVLSIKCESANSVEKIEEFLTDVPVAQFANESYGIEIKMNAQPYGSVGFEPESIVIEDENERVVYTKCCVGSIKCEILPRAAMAYTVKIAAGERRVENV